MDSGAHAGFVRGPRITELFIYSAGTAGYSHGGLSGSNLSELSADSCFSNFWPVSLQGSLTCCFFFSCFGFTPFCIIVPSNDALVE